MVSADDRDTLQIQQDKAQILLREYVVHRYPEDVARFGRLLLTLNRVMTISDQTITNIFFKETVGDIPMDKLIHDILKSASTH